MTAQPRATPALYDLSRPELEALLAGWGEPRYRAGQVWRWLYRRLPAGIAEMSDLPRPLRERLEAETVLGRLEPALDVASRDGSTHKLLFRLPDGQTIESVLMRYGEIEGAAGVARRTACISSQAGCGMGCVFCATGQMGLLRNLTAGEIVEQVLWFQRQLVAADERLTNIVLMGMGEPLANYGPTLEAIRRLIDPEAFAFGQRRITLSTVGLVPGIERFTAEGLQVNLAVSLHAATDELRNRLVPINRRYPLDRLIAACRAYVAQTHRRLTFEWALIAGVNDDPAQARALAARVKGLLCHVNVIPVNPTRGYAGSPSDRRRVAAFSAVLEEAGIPVTVRVRRGIDIDAGCGQLATEHKQPAASLGDREGHEPARGP
jgi:23S rRNA (adenine2503-C2)-methyltransferase